VAGALQRAWLGRGPLARALWPVSALYGLAATLHRGLYARGWRPAERLPAPVVVVGNVVAGGAGKTPVVMALLEHLAGRGIAAGVISRGHGRAGSDCREVRPDDDAALAGDEPLLVRRRSGVPVFVATRRAEAGRALLARYPATRVLVCDDGLQHHALAADVSLCVFDQRGIGNGWLLPAGPLREPWPRPVDLVLQHGDPPGIAGFRIERRLAAHAVQADGTRRSLGDWATDVPRPVRAVAGVANPEPFFEGLRAAGIGLDDARAFADHHAFSAGDLPAEGSLLCTEKDAVKIWRLRPQAWAVPLEVVIEPAFWPAFDRLLDAKLSSRHGSPPA